VVFPYLSQRKIEVTLVDHPDTVLVLVLAPREKQPLPESRQDMASAPKSKPESSSGAKSLEGQESYPTLDSLFSLYQPYAINFSTYEPTYFLVGTDPGKSKFQLSFKYRLFNPAGSLTRRFPWLGGLHFAYTQTSFWDLASDSAPFEDTSYKPELFLLTDNLTFRPPWMTGLFFQGGFRHESNGRGMEFSRSTNAFYIKPSIILFDPGSGLGLEISPRLLSYFNNNDTTNPDLEDYRGNFELELTFGKAEALVSHTLMGFAEEGISIQTGLSYPISTLLNNNLDLFFHLQYANTLGERLINYKEREQSVRLGISLVR